MNKPSTNHEQTINNSLQEVLPGMQVLPCAPNRLRYAHKNASCYSGKTLNNVQKVLKMKPGRQKKEDLQSWAVRMSGGADGLRQWRFDKKMGEIVKDDLRVLCTDDWKRCTESKDGIFKWLHQNDIEMVLKGYQDDTVRRFEYVPPSQDTKNTSRRIRSRTKSLNVMWDKRKSRIGFFYNTSPATHEGTSGVHWVAMIYIKTKHKLYYFDSMGKQPNTRIKADIENWKEAIADSTNREKPELVTNKIPYQTDQSECGVWAIHFIVQGMQLSKRKNKEFVHVLGPSNSNLSIEQKKLLRSNYFMQGSNHDHYSVEVLA